MKKLTDFPRCSLAHLPTPLEPMTRLRAMVGESCPSLWIKRDDCTGLAHGGNKTRKLEFLLGDALKQGATHIITQGAVQSNHVRQTAAACARVGLRCEVILTQSVPRDLKEYRENGNLLLDALLGAQVHYAADAQHAEVVKCGIEQAVRSKSGSPYFIPTGGSNTIGSLGYATMIAELSEQCKHVGIQGKVTLVHASASGGTQAGLISGNILNNRPFIIAGVNVYKPEIDQVAANIKKLVFDISQSFDWPEAMPSDFSLWNGYQGEAYGIPTPAGIDALHILARQEGILADPVYTGKALAGLLEQLHQRSFAADETVIFLHTGGASALHAYPDIVGK